MSLFPEMRASSVILLVFCTALSLHRPPPLSFSLYRENLIWMTLTDIVDLSSDDELGQADVKPVKLEPGLVARKLQHNENNKALLAKHQKSKTPCAIREPEENRSSNALSTGHSSSSILDQGQSPVDDTGLSYTSPLSPAPLCRQFWKAGSYNDGIGSKVTIQNGKNYLHVHPMFLHSNATSHKWAFCAIADLLDNAVDEIQYGATFVIVDKTSNPRDGSPPLLIQDKKMLRSSLSFIVDQMHDELLKLEGQPSKERQTFLKKGG